MGCSCKEAKKISRHIPSFMAKNNNDKKGWKKYFFMFSKYFLKLINGVIILLFMLFCMPLVVLMVLFNYIKHNELMMSIPFLKKTKKN